MSTEPETPERSQPAAGRRQVGGLLRTRDFGLLWAGESVSGFGSAVTTVALPLVAVSALHASVGDVALLTAATWLPWVLIGLPAGSWVDRWPRRRTLLAADLVSAVVLAVIPVAAWTGALSVAMLLAAALAAGTSSMFFSLAFNAYLPHLLAPGDRLEGNARLQTSTQAAQVAGPGLGGLLAQLAGPVCGLLADALTFVVSAACLLSLRAGPEPGPVQARRPRLIRQIAEGLEPWRHGGFLLPMLAVAATMNFAIMGVFALRIVFLVRTDGAMPGTAGVLIGLGSLGGLLGAALARRAVTSFGSARTYLTVSIATAPFLLLLPAAGRGWQLLLYPAGSFVVLAGVAMAGVITFTFRANYIPPHLLGRVTAATGFVVAGTVPLGAATAGALATALGVRSALWVLAALYAVLPTFLLATSLRTLRDFPDRPGYPAGPPSRRPAGPEAPQLTE